MIWILTIMSITGVILNIKQKQKISYILWSFTNISWCVIDYKAGLSAQAALFAVYFCLAIWGIYEWHKIKKITQKRDTVC